MMVMTSASSIRASPRGTNNVNKHACACCVMVRQSCAIGPCPEKTYQRTEGVKFFNVKYIKDPIIKQAWKKRILSTRADLKNESQINDAVICSRHFVDGDNRNLPTIIPKKVGNNIVWPENVQNRRVVVRRQLNYQSSASCSSSKNDDVDSSMGPSDLALDDSLDSKLQSLQEVLDFSPPKVVGDLIVIALKFLLSIA